MKSLLVLFLVSSCSIQSHLLKPKGATRVGIVQDEYKRPDFFISNSLLPHDFHKIKSEKAISRTPASFNLSVKTGKNAARKLSNRQLYFLSLYSQYKVMGKILKSEKQINSCPSFHQVILENEDILSEMTKFSDQYSTDKNLDFLKNEKKNLSLYPVLAMPYSEDLDLYSAIVGHNWENTSSHLRKAFKHYYHSSEKEISELCDKGIGPGYYIFENMVTYFKKENTFQKTNEAITALVKIPVLANMLILDNLIVSKNQKSSTLSTYDNWLLERTNAKWFGRFIQALKEKRSEHAVAFIKDNSKRTVLSLNR